MGPETWWKWCRKLQKRLLLCLAKSLTWTITLNIACPPRGDICQPKDICYSDQRSQKFSMNKGFFVKSNIFLTDDTPSFKKFICEVDLWWLGFFSHWCKRLFYWVASDNFFQLLLTYVPFTVKAYWQIIWRYYYVGIFIIHIKESFKYTMSLYTHSNSFNFVKFISH